MSSVPTGGSVCCACCNAAFHWLSSHLSWNARYAAFYDSLQSDLVNGVLDDVHRPDAAYFDKEGDTAGAGESRRNSRRASTVEQPIMDRPNHHYRLHYRYRYQRQIPSHHPPFHSSYRCECHSHKMTFASSSLMPQGFASPSHKTTFACSLLCCAYHVDRTTSSSRFVSL